MKKLIIVLLLSVISHGSWAQYCTGDSRFTQTPVFTDAQIGYDTSVVYGNALNYQGQYQDLRLSICYPKASVDTYAKRPLIILIHGGGFLTGHRSNLNTMCVEFAKRGFVAATIGYRLGWDTGLTSCGGDTMSNARAVYRGFQDAHAALRYLVAHADFYKIDTAWIFSGGESAGGVSSLNLAFTSQSEMNARLSFLEPELGPINQSGNALTNTFSLKGIFNNWGSIVETSFITAADAIPMIAFHGQMDHCLPYDSGTYNLCPGYIKLYGSASIYSKLQSLGVCAELTVKPNGDHGIYDETLASNIFRVNRATCFFKSLFCNACTSVFLNDSIAPDCSSVGIVEPEIQTKIVCYPNPCRGKFTVSAKGLSIKESTIDIYNTFGENIRPVSIKLQHETLDIDISDLPKGLYFLIISNPEKITSTKLIVE